MGATAPSISYIEDTEDSPPSTDEWHTDVTWTEEPPALAFLSACVMPPRGGDTMWASLYAAFDRLSPEMQRVCEGLSAWHWYGEPFAAAVSQGGKNPGIVEKLEEAYPPPGVQQLVYSAPLGRITPPIGFFRAKHRHFGFEAAPGLVFPSVRTGPSGSRARLSRSA